ncbi:hypothetical protein ACFCZ6_17465 [Streptomyces hydrogenans]|uniref:hypothetical protein n=1 Tax=Streptomyces hydrogenans TaxID=1873719 RepID=UPI0035D98378
MHTTGYTEAEYGGVTVLVGAERGAYPYANSVLVRGTAETLIIDRRCRSSSRRLPRTSCS